MSRRQRGRSAFYFRLPTEGLRQGHGLRGRRPALKADAWQPGAGQATTSGLWCGKIGPRFSAQTQGGLCWTEAGIMRGACLYRSSPGLCWAQVVPMLNQVGPMLNHLEPILSLCWAKSGPCWAIGPILGRYIGPIYWAGLSPCWAILGYVGLILGQCWAYVGPTLAYVSPMLAAHVEPSWDLCWGHVWDIYVETILRCQFFRPGPPPGAQNHVKTGWKHRLKKIFFNTASKIHRKLQGLQLTRSK